MITNGNNVTNALSPGRLPCGVLASHLAGFVPCDCWKMKMKEKTLATLAIGKSHMVV